MAIAVFAKAPIAGRVKTRLAARLGDEAAASLHERLVRRALDNALEADVGAVELWCAPDERHEFFRRCARECGVALHRQRGADLGARMRTSFDAAHQRRERLLLMGSDCPGLSPARLREAAQALSRHDAVVIPAEDGGYVLVGLATPVPGLFDGIDWGGDAVMAATRARLAASGRVWAELEALWDVDRPEDYERLVREGLLREAAA